MINIMEATRRSTRRTSRRWAENSESPTKQSRSVSCENQQRRKRRRPASESEPESELKSSDGPSSPVAEEIRKIQKKVVDGRHVDAFCWICHKLGDDLICNSCPRVYHEDCLRRKKLPLESGFCECKRTTVEGNVPSIPWSPPELAEMLKYAMQASVKEEKRSHQKSQKVENENFQKFFKTFPVIPENKILLKIMDIDILIDNIYQPPPYQNTGDFFLDVKWIYHNCFILYGANHVMTETALKLQNRIKQELLDIEACRECYERKHSKGHLDSDYFTRTCNPPHTIVWAKLRFSPFWPAKCLKIHNGHADVRFFGTHDKSNVSLNHIYLMSKVHPEGKNINKMTKLKEAMDELQLYIYNYENSYGNFEFHAKRVPLNEAHLRRSKKHHKRGKHNIRHSENSKVEKNHCSDLKKPQLVLTKVKGTFGSTAPFGQGSTAFGAKPATTNGVSTPNTGGLIGNTSQPTGSGLFGQTSNTFGAPTSTSTRTFEPLKMKVEDNLCASSHSVEEDPRREDQNDLESENVSNATFNESETLYKLTFTADDDTHQNAVSNPPLNNSISVNHPKKEYLSSFDEASHSASEKFSKTEPSLFHINEPQLLPMCSKIAQVKLDNFNDNANVSAPLPIITSAQSASEDNAAPIPTSHENCSSQENYMSSSAPIPPIPKESDSSEKGLPSVESESEDEIQVVKETHNNPLAEYILQNASLSKTLCELLLANKPTLRNSFQMLQTASHEFLLQMWLGMHAGKLDSIELKAFQLIYVKFLKKIESLKDQNAELKDELASLKEKCACQEAQINSLLEKKNVKDALREQIIKLSASSLSNAEIEKINFDQTKRIKELEEKNNELEQKNNELTSELEKFKDLENKIKEENMEKAKELDEKVKRNEDLNEQLNSYERTIKNQKAVIANYKKLEKMHKEQEMNQFCMPDDNIITEKNVPVIEEGAITVSESELNCSFNDKVLVKQNIVTTVPSSVGTFICEKSFVGEYDVVSPQAGPSQISFIQVPILPYQPVPIMQTLNPAVSSCAELNAYVPSNSQISQPSLQSGISSNLCHPETSYNSSNTSNNSLSIQLSSDSSKISSGSSKIRCGLSKPSSGPLQKNRNLSKTSGGGSSRRKRN